LAEFITRFGSQVERDLEELWKRIVFNICVTNTDDHLRNHGFLLSEAGWQLSPAFDINPIETGVGLKLNISNTDNSLDLELAKEVAPNFRIQPTKADAIEKQIVAIVKTWRIVASKFGISRSEQEMMSKAFRVE
jgi:serine/threonine-protein kinase HipA